MAILDRKFRDATKAASFIDDPSAYKRWREHWWGMPSFEMGDARGQYRIVVNFMTADDVRAFADVTGIPVTTRSDSAWFPHQRKEQGRYYWDGEKTDSIYPVCIPSKGRAACHKTARALNRLGVSYRFFVERTEYSDYVRSLGKRRVVRMPFHDLGKGSIPARNFIWDWAKDNGHKRHWVVDDNINSFARCTRNRRWCVYGGGFFRAMEDFVDRYENIAMAGPHDKAFVPDRSATLTPFLLNSRVYSCILIDTSLNYRWRGRYNEDTDLSLRVLKDGFCTVLFRALLMDKGNTVGAKGGKPLPGGNTDNVYNTGDHRLSFARSLAKQHPDCVTVVWKYNRWHHSVDYSKFKGNQLKLRSGVVPVLSDNEYGMRLVDRRKSGNESE